MTDIGSTLREARMRARIDISEVETRTKIRAKYLRAIENEEWDLLPGPVYVKSFLRTYSDYLGLDSRMLIDDYKRRYERPSDNEMRPIATLSRERERAARGPLLPPWVIIVAVLALVAGGLWAIGSLGSSKPSHSVVGLHAKPKLPATHRTTHRKKKVPRVAPAVPRTVKLQITPTTNPVYVCVSNGAGRRLINGVTYQVGQSSPVVRGGKLLVTLGNNGLTMKVNGKPTAVQASTGPIAFELTPTGQHALSVHQEPTCA